jgi:hypothetical protein
MLKSKTLSAPNSAFIRAPSSNIFRIQEEFSANTRIFLATPLIAHPSEIDNSLTDDYRGSELQTESLSVEEKYIPSPASLLQPDSLQSLCPSPHLPENFFSK